MKVILLKAVQKLGKVDDIVEVPDGHAANALFPKKLAVQATPALIDAVKKKHLNRETRVQIQHDLLDRAISQLEGASLTYTARANEKGSLFSKIDTEDISKALLAELRISIDAKHLTIREGAIKHTGIYTVDVADGSYKTELSVHVVGK